MTSYLIKASVVLMATHVLASDIPKPIPNTLVHDYIEFMRKDLNAPLEFWPTEKVREFCKTERYYAGFYSPEDYQFHPLNYARGLAEAIGLHFDWYQWTTGLDCEIAF